MLYKGGQVNSSMKPSSAEAHSSDAFQEGDMVLVWEGVGWGEDERVRVGVEVLVRVRLLVSVAVREADAPWLCDRVMEDVREGVLLGEGMMHSISTCRYW